MTNLVLILRALEYILLFAQAFFREHLRREGREQVVSEQKQAHEQAQARADQIDRDVADADLDALRERMRQYQRPADAL